MEKTIQLKRLLIEREGYTIQRAAVVALEAESLSPELSPLLRKWVLDSNDMPDCSVHDVSIRELQEKTKMNYIAALLTMDWLIKEPEKATPFIMNLLNK